MANDVVQVYKDHNGKWRWRKMAANGKIISSSGEDFSSRRSAKRAGKRANPGIDLVVTK
jgi:uncharacterized protein YegP (UPF0339 family)